MGANHETGLRKGEVAVLLWTDIDLNEMVITISKTLDSQAKNKDELFVDPKTYNSKHKVMISQLLLNDLFFI